MIAANFEKSSARKASFILRKVMQGAITLNDLQWLTRESYKDEWEARVDPLKGLLHAYYNLEAHGATSSSDLTSKLVDASWYDMVRVTFQGVELWLFAPHLMSRILTLFEEKAEEFKVLYSPATLGEMVEMEYHTL
jgi:hypothetical protein